MEQLPLAILKPKATQSRPELYQVYLNPKPRNLKNQDLLLQLRPFLTMEPTVVDLETEGNRAEILTKRVAVISLANSRAVSSWHLLGDDGPKVWTQILELLYKHQTPLIAHNLNFDAAWMLRDLNLRDGVLPEWVKDFRRLNLYACTYGLMRTFASEGFIGQQYSLEYCQKHMLQWDESNKVERGKRLFESGLLKKLPSREILLKLFNGDKDKVEEFRERFLNSRRPNDEGDKVETEHQEDG